MGELAVEDERRFGNVSVSAQIVDVGSGRHLRWWVLPVVVVVVVVVVVTQLLVVLVVGIFRHRGGWVGDFRTLFVEQRHLVRFFLLLAHVEDIRVRSLVGNPGTGRERFYKLIQIFFVARNLITQNTHTPNHCTHSHTLRVD